MAIHWGFSTFQFFFFSSFPYFDSWSVEWEIFHRPPDIKYYRTIIDFTFSRFSDIFVWLFIQIEISVNLLQLIEHTQKKHLDEWKKIVKRINDFLSVFLCFLLWFPDCQTLKLTKQKMSSKSTENSMFCKVFFIIFEMIWFQVCLPIVNIFSS